jgi:hypothetical protein
MNFFCEGVHVAAPKNGKVHHSLQRYLDQPEIVTGWVTDQAVVMKDGTMKVTSYLNYGHGGLVLRSALDPISPESTQGLWRRWECGERFLPLSEIACKVAYDLLDRASLPHSALNLHRELVDGLAHPENMNKSVFEKLQALAESMDLEYAMGQDAVDGFDERHAEVARLLDAAPYQMHPDYGCVLNGDVERLDAEAMETVAVYRS